MPVLMGLCSVEVMYASKKAEPLVSKQGGKHHALWMKPVHPEGGALDTVFLSYLCYIFVFSLSSLWPH